MCYFYYNLWFLGPRFAFLIYWLIPYGRLKIIAAFNTWFWPLLGLPVARMLHSTPDHESGMNGILRFQEPIQSLRICWDYGKINY